eukprot:6176358-Pleurochrysis_carterae.AAC.2
MADTADMGGAVNPSTICEIKRPTHVPQQHQCRGNRKRHSGVVIGALHKGDVFVPYRDSKLTRILKESLGGRCKTTVIVTLSPTAASETESASTLRYAEQARYIRNRPTARCARAHTPPAAVPRLCMSLLVPDVKRA